MWQMKNVHIDYNVPRENFYRSILCKIVYIYFFLSFVWAPNALLAWESNIRSFGSSELLKNEKQFVTSNCIFFLLLLIAVQQALFYKPLRKMACKWPNKCMSATFVWCNCEWLKWSSNAACLCFTHSHEMYVYDFSSAWFYVPFFSWYFRFIEYRTIFHWM